MCFVNNIGQRLPHYDNKTDEIGSPYLTPFSILKGIVGEPLSIMEIFWSFHTTNLSSLDQPLLETTYVPKMTILESRKLF